MFTSCLNACACAIACVQRAEDNLQQSALSHHSVGLQSSNTGHQALFTWSHLLVFVYCLINVEKCT